jgi:hypothetical protein
MLNSYHRARCALAVVATVGALGACSDVEDQLLEPQQPGIISPDAVNSPTAADALRKGALGRLRSATEGNVWLYNGLLADEWKTGDTFIQRVETDQRVIQMNNAEINGVYTAVHRTRGSARDAIKALQEYLPTPAWYQAQMWWTMGLSELLLSENWCSGVPFGNTVDGVVPTEVPPMTMEQSFAYTMTHLDSALNLIPATVTDTAAITHRRAIQITRARVLINQGKFAEAAAAVAGIPTNYRYVLTHSLTTSDVAAWSLNNSQKRWVVSDSFDTHGRIRNAIPFASARDPRVPTTGASLNSPLNRAFDNSTWFVQQGIWSRSDQIPLLSGVDARLIEAEARLQANDIPGMMTILNALRAAPQWLGSAFNSPVMPNLATPATQTEAVDLFFREKAFWQFGRGYRLPDLRRLVRQYNRTQENVFPAGTFFKTDLPYGTDVNFPVTSVEQPNPLYNGCIDRKA